MNVLEKIKLTGELKKAIDARNAENHPLKKIALQKTVQDLRKQLCLVGDQATNSDEYADANKGKEINVAQFETDLKAYQESDDADFKSAVERVLAKLQGNYIQTVVGKVLFNSVSTGELALGTKENEIRANLIPFVPQTLTTDKNPTREENIKDRSNKKGKFVAFHSFIGTAQIGDKNVKHLVRVGERENGEFIFVAYHSRAILDSIKGTFAPDTVSNIKAGRSEATIPFDKNNTPILDNVQADYNGWNIEILEVTDLEGNPISLDDESQSAVNSELALPEDATLDERVKAVKSWLQNNLIGKVIKAVDGKEIYFNSNLSLKHLTHNARKSISDIVAKSIPHIAEVFESGKFVQRQELSKNRTDNKVAFHIYEKWIEIENRKVRLEAKACELADGTFIAKGDVVAYNLKALEQAFIPSNLSQNMTTPLEGIQPATGEKDTLIADDVQVENDDYVLNILEITDLDGNPISLDDEPKQNTYNLDVQELQALWDNPLDQPKLMDLLKKALSADPTPENQCAIFALANRTASGFIPEVDAEVEIQWLNSIVDKGRNALGELFAGKEAIDLEQIQKEINQLEKAVSELNTFNSSKDNQHLIDELVEKTEQEVGFFEIQDKINEVMQKQKSAYDEKDMTAYSEIYDNEFLPLFKQKQEKYIQFKEVYLAHLADYEPFKQKKAKVDVLNQHLAEKGEKILSLLYEASQVSAEQAEQQVKENVTIESGFALKSSDEEILKNSADFQRLTNGQLKNINYYKHKGRAFTKDVQDKVSAEIYGGVNRKTQFHELGHNLELDPKAQALAQAFLKKRRVSDKIYSLKALGERQYSSKEKAYKDHWINPYIGKYYENGTTEVFSMAMEYLSNPQTAAMFVQKDPEMAALVIGYLKEGKSKWLDFAEQHIQAKDAYYQSKRQEQKNADKALINSLGIRFILDDKENDNDKLGKELMIYFERNTGTRRVFKKGAKHRILGYYKAQDIPVVFILAEHSHIKGQKGITPKLCVHQFSLTNSYPITKLYSSLVEGVDDAILYVNRILTVKRQEKEYYEEGNKR